MPVDSVVDRSTKKDVTVSFTGAMNAVLPDDVGMHETPRAPLVANSLAVLATVASLLVRWGLWPLLGNAVPHMTCFPAVVIAAYFGGLWPGLLATILSALAANYSLTRELRSFGITDVN